MMQRQTWMALLMVASLTAAGCKKKEESAGEPSSPPPAPAADAAGTPTPEPPAPDAAQPDAAPATPEATDTAQREATFEELVAASEPLHPTVTPQKLGEKEITAEVCTYEGIEILGTSAMELVQNIAVTADGKLYLVDKEGLLLRFTFKEGDACVLVHDKTFGTDGKLKLDREIDTLNVDSNNKLYASSGIWSSYRLTEGTVDYECKTDPNGYIVPFADGSGGFGYWSRPELVKLSFTDTGCTGEKWTFESPLDLVQSVGFMKDLILVAGTLKPEINPDHAVVVAAFDKDGKLQFQFGSTEKGVKDDTICWAKGVSVCPSGGICVLDGNCRKMSVWSEKGEFQGKIDLDKLFGLEYPWFPDFQLVGDVFYVVALQKREKSPVVEALVYRLRGL